MARFSRYCRSIADAVLVHKGSWLSELFGVPSEVLLGRPPRVGALQLAARLRDSELEVAAGGNIVTGRGARTRVVDLLETEATLNEIEGVLPTQHGAPGMCAGIDPVDAAAKLREVLGLGVVDPVGDLGVSLSEKMGIHVLIEPFGAYDGVTAVSDVGVVIAATSNCVSGRTRFSIAHELAHVVLGTCDGVRCLGAATAAISDVEADADSFASALLLPEAGLRSVVTNVTPETMVEAMCRFGVSWKALTKALVKSQIAEPEDLTELLGKGDPAALFARAGRSADLPPKVSDAVRSPVGLEKRTIAALEAGRVSTGFVARFWGVTQPAAELRLHEASIDFGQYR